MKVADVPAGESGRVAGASVGGASGATATSVGESGEVSGVAVGESARESGAAVCGSARDVDALVTDVPSVGIGEVFKLANWFAAYLAEPIPAAQASMDACEVSMG